MKTLTLEDCIDLERIFGYVFYINDGRIIKMKTHDEEEMEAYYDQILF